MTRDERPVLVRVVCEAPPLDPSVEFGLQEGDGTLAPGTRAADGSLAFEAPLRAVKLADGTVRLRGPIVHGPPAARFLYLSCRPAGSAAAPWIFRLKVPLTGIDGSAPRVEARIRASPGGTVPLLGGGWTRMADE